MVYSKLTKERQLLNSDPISDPISDPLYFKKYKYNNTIRTPGLKHSELQMIPEEIQWAPPYKPISDQPWLLIEGKLLDSILGAVQAKCSEVHYSSVCLESAQLLNKS